MRLCRPLCQGCGGSRLYDPIVIKRVRIRIAVIGAIVLLAALLTTAAEASRRLAPRPSSALAACISAGGSYDDSAWRAPADAFGGFSCTYVTFDGPAALSRVDPSLRSKLARACSRAHGAVVPVATFTNVGYGCLWAR